MFKRQCITTLLSAVLILSTSTSSCEGASQKRMEKTRESDRNGGLNRIVTVYDENGNEIKRYEGKIDIEDNENKVLFDIPTGDGDDSKRVVIYNAIVIAEEK